MISELWTRLHVEELAIADAGLMSELHGAVFARAWGADEIANLIAGAGVFALGLWRRPWLGGRALAGFVLMREAADEGEVLTIAVDRTWQGRGYGRLLMEEALRRLYRDGVASCFLEVDAANATAVSLYRSLGFRGAGRREGYYASGGTALVMRSQLR